MNKDYIANHQTKAELDISPELAQPTWARFCEGWDNLAPQINEVVEDNFWLCDEGWGSSDVVAAHFKLELTGKRIEGDALQDWVFGTERRFGLGNKRKTRMRLTSKNGMRVEVAVTMTKIDDGGGAANAGSEISLELSGNGKPIITNGNNIARLIVVSVAGGAGKTAVHINPIKDGTNTYAYRLGGSKDLPMLDEVCDTAQGWTAWNGTVEVTAATGTIITVVEVDAAKAAKKAGQATITAG